ncbi:MAG: type II secretion system F family protein [Kofleriaceae bacterium]|nr:type II secretion system F family protein [Kofleriaceae bacterium]
MDAAVLNSVSAGCAVLGSLAAFAAYARARAASRADESSDEEGPPALWRRLLAPVASHLRPTVPDELYQLETSLQMAGRRSRDAIDRFCEERFAAVILGVVFALFAAAAVGGLSGMMIAMGSLVLGLIGPRKFLDLKAGERRDAVATGLPGAIDLLTTCIDAGLSLEHALARVAKEIAPTSPVLSDEFSVIARELEAGVPLPDGLRRLSRRVGLDDLSALCGVLAQAHGLGAPIANTLRDFAMSSRRARMSMLEERAGKLAASMTIPLATCLLPAAILIIIGPAVLQLVRALHG